MPGSYAKVIVNPVAGSRSVGREWQRISRQLQKAGLSFDYEFTKGTGDAIEIAKRAADGGYQCLIAVGGDGTEDKEITSGYSEVTPKSGFCLIILTLFLPNHAGV